MKHGHKSLFELFKVLGWLWRTLVVQWGILRASDSWRQTRIPVKSYSLQLTNSDVKLHLRNVMELTFDVLAAWRRE